MTILVAYASAHWSTKGIALEIGDRLTKAGFKAAVHAIEEVGDLSLYDAVVLGSAIHNHAWLPEAARFLIRHVDELARLPVWLFSVDPVGNTSSFFGPKLRRVVRQIRREPSAVVEARRPLRPRDHRHFVGAVQRGQWNRVGDLFLKLCGGCPGDYRDWRDVHDWARRISQELETADRTSERKRLRLVPRGGE